MTLLAQEGLTDQRADIIFEWTNGRTTSARELTPAEIAGMCTVLQADKLVELDRKRKRLIASIFGVYNKMHKKVTMDYVKGIACRAAKVDDFNRIPAARLDSLYAAFLNAQKDLNFAGRMVEGFINEQQSYN